MCQHYKSAAIGESEAYPKPFPIENVQVGMSIAKAEKLANFWTKSNYDAIFDHTHICSF